MAARKRARTSSNGGSSSSRTVAPTITLDGGEACPTKQVALWRSGRLTDTVVTVEGATFSAHRLVLAAASDYFERHYDHEHMRDADHPKLLEHVTAAAFEPLLAFLYEGRCTFEESLLAPVLRAANYLNVAPLERAAVLALTERLSPSNALTAWTWGEELELPQLTTVAKETALRGFDEVEKIEEATLAQMQELVADDRLTAKSEEAVFSAVARFAEAKQPAEVELLGLLRNVRFPLMSKDFLLGTVRTWQLLDTKAGQALLFEMVAPYVSGLVQQPRHGLRERFLYVMGGSSSDQSERFSSVEIYDVQMGTWAAGTPLPSPRQGAAAAVLGPKIYVMGSFVAETHTAGSSVDVFDPRTGMWAAGVPMMQKRDSAAAVTVDGKIFVIGGHDGDDTLSSVEAFDPETGAWAEVAPMATARCLAGVAVLDGKIYMVGGMDDNFQILDGVEVYDPQTNTWASAPPMSTRRVEHGVAVLDGKIYAVGGLGDHGASPLISAEVFDPQTNTWAGVAPMGAPRAAYTLNAMRGKLYAVGGVCAAAEELTVEAYDPQQNRWESVAPMAQARCRAAAAVCV